MNQEEFDAIRKYSMLTFGNRTISVKTCLKCIEEDAKDAGMTVCQFLSYIYEYGQIPAYK